MGLEIRGKKKDKLKKKNKIYFIYFRLLIGLCPDYIFL
jgi:hypothetical protein